MGLLFETFLKTNRQSQQYSGTLTVTNLAAKRVWQKESGKKSEEKSDRAVIKKRPKF